MSLGGLGRARRSSGGALRPFLILTAVSVVLLLARNADPVRATASTGTQLLVPLERVLADAGASVGRFTRAITEIEFLRNDNSRLRGDVDRLTLENVRLREDAVAARQSVRLGAATVAVSLPSIQAAVVARDPSGVLHTMVLDQGIEAGVREGHIVITELGVVGRISEVGPGYSKVLLVTDSSSTVSALVQGSRANGIVRGQYGDTLVMDWVLQTVPVKTGDVVITAGLGLGNELRSLYPKGLVLGTIVEVARSDTAAYLRAVLVPAVDFRRLERVLVVKTS